MEKKLNQEKITEVLREAGRPLAAESIIELLEDEDPEQIRLAIEEMEEALELLPTRKAKLALPEQVGLLRGRMQGNARGYGFVIPEDGSQDLYIAAEAMHGAMHGDTVYAKPVAQRYGNSDRVEGEVIAVICRKYRTVVGTYLSGYVVPDERRISCDLLVQKGGKSVPQGVKVVAKITAYPDGRKPLAGVVTEVLGKPGDQGVDVMSVIRRLGIRETFPRQVIDEAAAMPRVVTDEEIAGREDWRDRQVVTIDGRDSKDFDDAVSIERLKNGNWVLGVHIADVTQYVKKGAPLDKEARIRGTSVYFADRVIPMLPEQLSNGICSLNEGVNRLTLSCVMEVNSEGRVVSHRIVETVIRSLHRLVYDDVSALLAGDEAQLQKYSDIAPMLRELEALQKVLYQKRMARGSIDFELAESNIVLNEQGQAVDLKKAERGIANRIIEECMLLANETVAAHMNQAKLPYIYRVHETPDPEKMRELNVFLHSLGYGMALNGAVRPAVLQKAVESSKGSEEEAIVGRLILRSMQKARYCEECLGHFGLACRNYTHFTSPIRRYPDLVGHRILKQMLHGALDIRQQKRWQILLPEIATETSEKERSAMEAERAVDDLKKCEYMASKVGEEYHGVISGVLSFGMFVELSNTAEGLVRMQSLNDDYYELDEKNYRLVGRRTGRIYRLGDPVTVRVAAVDLPTTSIDLELKTDYDNITIYNLQKPRDKAPVRPKTNAVRKKERGHAQKARRQSARPKQKGKT